MKKSDHEAAPSEMFAAHHFDQLGKLSWLWMNSPLHREWSVDMAARFLLPPIHLNQIEILERDGVPVAYCSWAWLSEAAEIRYMIDPSDLNERDWNSGDRLWFADWVAPFGAADSWHLRSVMAARFPQEVARAIRVKRGSKRARVMEFKGPKLPAAIGHDRLRLYYEGFLRTAASLMPGALAVRPAGAIEVEAGAPGAANPGAAPQHNYVS